MGMNAVAASVLQCNATTVIAAALVAAVCIGTHGVSAAECGPHCNRNVQPNLYGDPRCGPRDLVRSPSSTQFPTPETKASRCDSRERPKQAHHHVPAVTPQPPSPSASSVGNVPAIGANSPGMGGASGASAGATDPGRPQTRTGVDRDVGFNDAFGTRVEELRAAPRAPPAGAGGLGTAGGASHGRP